MCITLGILGGNYFQKFGVFVGGISQHSQGRIIRKIVRAINLFCKDSYLHFPSEEMLRSNSQEYEDKKKLPGFGWSIDGVHMIFGEKPRDIPDGIPPINFHNRKLRYIHCLNEAKFVVN